MSMDRDFVSRMEEAADKYEREVEKFGAKGELPRQATIQNANEQALQGTVALANAQAYAAARQDTLDYHSMLHEWADRDVVEDWPTEDDIEREYDSVSNAWLRDQQNERDFYEAVYRVDPILTDYTRENLGQHYEDFVNQKHLEEQELRDAELNAQRAEAREMGGAKSVFRDKTGGYYQSLVSPDGEDTHDDYGFDEP